MKTRILTYASLIFSAAALLSCQKLEEVNEPLVAAGTHSVIVTTDATRTVNGDMHTYFEDGDKMTVIYRRSGSSNYHANEYTYSASSGQFTGSASLSSGNSYYWWGIYPYSSSNTNATSVSVSIPVSQTQVGNDSKAALAGEGFPLVGKTGSTVKGSTTPQFNVSNVATVLDFKITNGSATPLTVTKVEFTAPSGIAGTFSADLTQSTISWKAASSASKTVTLNVASGEAIANGAVAHFYAGAGPFSGAGSYTIEVTAKNAEGQTFVSSKTINGSLDCKSSTINTISHTFVPGAPVTEKTYKKVTTAPTDWSGTYLIVKESANVAFAYNQSNNGYKTSVTISNGTITTNDLEAYEVTVSESSLGAGKYDVKVGGQYLYKYGNSTDPTFFDSNISGNNQYFAEFIGDSDVNINFHRSGGSNNYFQYNGDKFCFGGTNTSTVQLYKLSEGDTPDVPPTPTTKYYELVTSEPASWDGTYLIVNAASGNAYAFDYSTAGTNNYASGKAVSISDGKIYSNATIDACAVTVSKYGDSHGSETEHAAYDIKVANGKYLYRYSNKIIQDSSEQGSGSSKRQNQHTLVYDNGVRMMFSGNQSGKTNNKYYFHYSSSQFTYESGKETDRVYFFRLVDGDQPEKQTQTLSFANSAVEWTLGDTYKVGSSYDAQSVSGANTTVTLTSSNASVATISDGKIKIVGEGTTTIIATAAEDDTYYSASASYTLKISPAPVQPSTKTYTKVTSFTSGKKYVIVYDGKALQNNGGTPAAYSVTASGNTLTLSSDVASTLEWTATTVSTYTVSGHYSLTNNGKYAARTDDGKNGFEFQTSAVQKAVWDLDSDGNDLYHKNSSGQYTFYLTYSSSKWTVSSQNASNKIAVYAEDGDTPVVPPTPTTEKTYTKVSTITAGRNYVIAHSNNALQNNDGSAKAFSISGKVSNNTLTLTASDASSLEWKASASSSTKGEFKFANGGTYAYRETSTNVIKLSASAEEDRSSWTLSGTQLYNINSGGSKYYLNYSGTQWQATTGGSSAAITVYEENDGSTPDTPTPSGTTFNLENSSLSSYLNDVASSYTNSNYSTTVVKNYASSFSKDDVPAPVKLSWTGSATSISIYEGTSTSGTAVKSQSFTSSSSVDVYNLIPGKTYSYKTSNNQTGTFKTEGRRRMIKVSDNASQSHARNCRDFGGIKTAAGQSLKYGLIYRGTNMDSITSDEKNVLLNELGIKMDVDLRGLQSGKSPLGSSIAVSGNGYQSGELDESKNDSKIAQTLTDIMNYVIDGKPVYIHCLIGSDRTGYMCMLLQALLGVSKKECDIDYEITSFAGGIVGGTRPKEYTDNKDFRNKFVKSPYSADQVPQSVENYVTSTLKISLSTVKSFRKAMGVNETLN